MSSGGSWLTLGVPGRFLLTTSVRRHQGDLELSPEPPGTVQRQVGGSHLAGGSMN